MERRLDGSLPFPKDPKKRKGSRGLIILDFQALCSLDEAAMMPEPVWMSIDVRCSPGSSPASVHASRSSHASVGSGSQPRLLVAGTAG